VARLRGIFYVHGVNTVVAEPELSWNTHALMTLAALRLERSAVLDEHVRVVLLEDLLQTVAKPLNKLFRPYWELLWRKVKGTPDQWTARTEITTARDFLEALRANPRLQLRYVRVATPEEVPSEASHSVLRDGPPGAAYVGTRIGAEITVREALSTFSDEPDWGMDDDLFPIEKYGYGPCPYGSATGVGSRAPFHMAFFARPNLLCSSIVPRLKRNFVEERVRIFLKLAELAFSKRIDYWGWRFGSWALHYLQDLTEPYHVKVNPVNLTDTLTGLKSARSIRDFVNRHKARVVNRHVRFEAVVHFILNDVFKKRYSHPFPKALENSCGTPTGPLKRVMRQSARIAAGTAWTTDRTLDRLLEESRIDDPQYHAWEDHDYPLADRLAEAALERPRYLKEFTDTVCISLAEAGRITRYVVRRLEDFSRLPR